MNASPQYPRSTSSVDGTPSLRVDASMAQDSSQTTGSMPESPCTSIEFDFRGVRMTWPAPKNCFRNSLVFQNAPRTRRMVLMKRNIIRKIPAPIRTALMALRGKSSTKIKHIVSEPFNVSKIIDGHPQHMDRYDKFNEMAPREPCIPLSSHPFRISELDAMNERSPMMSPMPGPRSDLCFQKSSPPCLTIKIPELSTTTVDGKTVDPSMQRHRPVRTSPTLTEARAWKIHSENARKACIKLGHAIDQVEVKNRKLEDDNEQLEDKNRQLKDKNRQLEEYLQEMRTARAAPSQYKVFSDHFRMLYERELKKVDLLEKELETALADATEKSEKVKKLQKQVDLALELADASTAYAESLKLKNPKRYSSQKSTESTESWGHSDEEKFFSVKRPTPSRPPSPTVSMIPSLDSSTSTSESDDEDDGDDDDDRKGWMTASQILGDTASYDESDLHPVEHTEIPTILNSTTELPTLPNFPTEKTLLHVPTTTLSPPAFTPGTTPPTTLNHVSLNHNITCRVGPPHPAVFRIPISSTPDTPAFSASVSWCPTLDMWEWCSVPEVKLTDFVADEKKKKRCSGRVFHSSELMTLRLSTGTSS
ncbi:f895fbcc-e109-401c-9281-67aaebf42b2c-CDS [Sclerotinia trifoliorum]|uniref:F895fbcc-e109-401c-9281-67aaebf42b2c-CDS n=1 Tax=Sclerotinia trifoliorum TaxID=28548 RepID=A0A8H2W139_9HELO|nr:f895fbcc-e109-401c-9281-67aaebf42b2c-CDS [Sclerotinia trifoliorum]